MAGTFTSTPNAHGSTHGVDRPSLRIRIETVASCSNVLHEELERSSRSAKVEVTNTRDLYIQPQERYNADEEIVVGGTIARHIREKGAVL